MFSETSTNNFTIYQPSTPDGTLRIGQGNADSPTEVARITADGVADANGTLLSNTPAFSVQRSANQNISETTKTKVQFNTENFDTDSAYDNSTNYRFTVPTGKAGKYHVDVVLRLDGGANTNIVRTQLYVDVNGTTQIRAYPYPQTGRSRAETMSVSGILDLSESDYVEVYAYIDANDGTGGTINSSAYTRWAMHKLII